MDVPFFIDWYVAFGKAIKAPKNKYIRDIGIFKIYPAR